MLYRALKTFYNYAKGILSELYGLIILILTAPLDLAKKDPTRPTDKKGTPILLVHGYLHSSSAWVYLRYYFNHEGFGPIYTINLGSPFHTIEDYAERVRTKAQWIARKTGRPDLILIGHSMGGLVSTYYATNIAPKHTVKAVVTLGSPLQGTKLAPLGIGACTKQMNYLSEFTQSLSRDLARGGETRYLHLGTTTDLMIRPIHSAWPNTPNAVITRLDGIGHIALLYTPSVAKTISAFLKKLT